MGAESFEPVIVAGEHLVELRGGARPPSARPAIAFTTARPSAASAAEDERQVGSQVGASEARGALGRSRVRSPPPGTQVLYISPCPLPLPRVTAAEDGALVPRRGRFR